MNKRFVIGVDKTKMRLYDVEQSAQDDIVDDTPAFDKGRYAEREELDYKGRFDKAKFDGFK